MLASDSTRHVDEMLSLIVCHTSTTRLYMIVLIQQVFFANCMQTDRTNVVDISAAGSCDSSRAKEYRAE